MEGRRRSPDIWLFLITIVLLVIGIGLVFDASYPRAGQAKFTGGDSYYFMKRQAVFAVFGMAALLVAMKIPYWRLRRFVPVLLALSMIGLIAVLVPGIGREVNFARRWIVVGPISIQPSEFAKLALVLYLADHLSHVRTNIRDLQSGLLMPLIIMGLMAGAIMKEPDMGTTIVFGGTGLALLYIAGARSRHMAVICGATVLAGIALVIVAPYRMARLAAWPDPFVDYFHNGYQICRSLIALGSGGPLGQGLCEGREKVFYLPEVHTDFILATLGEEMGLIGTMGLAALFLFFCIRGFRIAKNTKENFGKFLAAGLTCMVVGQALLNMLVVTSTIPGTGVPLPFISYGGSSLVLNLIVVGILLGISQYPEAVDKYEDRPYRRRNRRSRVPRY